MREPDTHAPNLKEIYQRLDPAKPLEPTDKLYQPIYGTDGREDPVARLQTHIQFNDAESLQMFSGFRGSGKTTELYRLRKKLRDENSLVVYANALDYLNPSEPVTITDLLLVLAGAFSDQLEKDFGLNLGKESFWNRITSFIKSTSLEVSEASIKAETDTPAKEILGGLNAGLELKFAIKEASSFREKLRDFLQNRLPELKKQANQFFEEGVKALRKKEGKRRIIFIFDQLEQLRGSASNEQEVIQSVERIFASHIDKLRWPYIHVIYTVPPWLQFVLPGGTDVEILPSLRLWKNDVKRSPCDAGWKIIQLLVERRFGQDGLDSVFGAAENGKRSNVDDLIAASGGHFRDLFRLFREVLVRAETEHRAVPVPKEMIIGAIKRIREQYLPITEEDAVRLEEIQTSRTCVLANNSAEEIGRTSRLLDLHLMLYFSNGGDWHDTHPLIREEITAIMQRIRNRPKIK